ncbi:MAG TPA: FCSD flavin-binding domain-containing protein [Acetobacteraceae bacterium]
MKRRTLLAASLTLPFAARAQGAAKVVVIGGGFGGASAARALSAAGLNTVLVEANADYYACPFSNAVVAGLRDMAAQRFTLRGLQVVRGTATAIDPSARVVRVGETALPYDRLILSPGIDLDFAGLPGYDQAAAEAMPHAWKAGPQTLLLRDRLAAMEDGGVVAMAIPPNPYRCPPGPYERASLIAYYLKTHKPRSKLLLLDAKDVFSKQALFTAAWARLYPGLVEWVGLSNGGKVTRVEPGSGTLETEFGSHHADVANVIPPQRAGAIAAQAGVADRTGWCPIDPVSFESRLVPGIHVIGDAAIAGAMPKSAFSANAQAKVCADAVIALLAGQAAAEPRLINTCYSLIAPDAAISVAGVYKPTGGVLADIPGAGGTSPLDAPPEARTQEALYADAWFRTITAEAFG